MTPELKLAIDKIIHYGKNYSIGIVILSIVDVLVGIASIFLAFMYIPLFGSTMVALRVFKSAVQYKKLQKVALGAYPLVVEYIKIRKKENFKMAKKIKPILKKVLLALFGNKFTLSMLLVCASFAFAVFEWLPLDFYSNLIIGAVVFMLSSYLVVKGKIGIEDIEQITSRLENASKIKADIKEKDEAKKLLIKKEKDEAIAKAKAKEAQLNAEVEKFLAEKKAKEEAEAKAVQPK